MQIVCYWFLKFMYYAFIGYLIEVFFALIKDHKFINRGFLIGPYCSIYGVAGIVLSFFNPQLNVVLNFLLAMLCCGLIEGSTGYLLDKMFKMRWWDYRSEPLNLNGYICIRFMILFGLFSLVGIYFLNPMYDKIFDVCNPTVILTISIGLSLFYLLDLIISNYLIIKIKKMIDPAKRSNTTLIIKMKKDMLLKCLKIAK